MKAYLDMVVDILSRGVDTENRTKFDTRVLPFQHFDHNMAEGFPLLTTKKMPLRTIAVELYAFIHGINSKAWLKEHGCHIWDHWCNPQAIPEGLSQEAKQAFQKECDDLGPYYGVQWRRWNEVYDEDDEGYIKGIDQLSNVIHLLKHNPTDRRIICNSWNIGQIDRMALPPCHYTWSCVPTGNILNLSFVMRSVDIGVGLPFNIALYALLLLLLSKECELQPGRLHAFLENAHIYTNQFPALIQQLDRKPRPLPQLEIVTPGEDFSFYDWFHNDYKLIDYHPHDKLHMGEIAV